MAKDIYILVVGLIAEFILANVYTIPARQYVYAVYIF